jgi:hypothetical protein
MIFIGSSYFNEELGDEDVDLEMPNYFFWEDLEKISKTFFQSIEAKKSKIVDKISSNLEVLKRDGAKIVLVENNH